MYCKKSFPEVIWEEPRRHPSLQKMDSPAFTSNQLISTIHPPDRPTDRQTHVQTDGWARRQLCSNTRLRSIVLIQSDARLKITSFISMSFEQIDIINAVNAEPNLQNNFSDTYFGLVE